MPCEETKPTTEAEAEDQESFFAYSAAYTKSVGRTFGSRLDELNRNHAKRIDEKAKISILETTESIRTKIPKIVLGDGIIWLDVGFAKIIASTLFPCSNHLADLFSEDSAEHHADVQTMGIATVTGVQASDTGKCAW